MQKANSDLISPSRSRWRRPAVHFPRGRTATIVLLVVGFLLVGTLATAGFLTYKYNEKYDGRFLPGVTIAGLEVSGMTHEEATAAVTDWIAPRLDRSIQLSHGSEGWTITPRELGARTNMAAVIKRAFEASAETGFVTRMRMRLFDHRLGLDEQVNIHHPRKNVKAFVANLAEDFDRDPRDSSIDYSSGWVKLVKEREGRTIQQKQTSRLLLGTLRGGGDSIDLNVKTVAPEITRSAFDEILLLHIGENRLYFYDGGKIKHEWTVATGQPAYPTPTGLYEITLKRYMPTWVNPDPEGWGATMPDMIPPGPGNPLGTRALNWSADGIRFHGTSATYSLGHNASHGCVRMAMSDVESLYEMVDVGTPIVSVNYGSWSPMSDEAANN